MAKVALPHVLSVDAVFLGYEPRGISVRADKAQGSMIVTPEQAFQGALETGDKIVLGYELRYEPARKGQGFQTQARVGAVLVSVEKVVPEVGASSGRQGALITAPESRK